MDQPNDLYEDFVASQKEGSSKWPDFALKLLFGVVAVATISIVELPAFLAVMESATCVERTGDPSCVSVIEGAVFWQCIALPIVAIVLWLILRPRP